MTLYAILEDLPSYKFYKQFDEGDSSTYNSFCKEEVTISSNDELVELCSKILKNLKLIDETKEDTFHNKHCDDINYWIGEQLKESHGVTDAQLNNSNFNDVTAEEKRRRKNLYDYYENYEKLEHIFIQKGKKCSKEHYEYLDKCVTLYNETKQYCTPGKTYVSKKCPSFFNYSEIYYPKKDLSVMPCELKVQSETSVRLVSETEMSAKEDVEISSLSDVPVSSDKSDTHSTSTPSLSLSSTLMTTSIPVLGSCFFLFIIYRWTPIGSLIRNRLLKGGEKINELSDNVTGKLWEDTMDPFTIDSDNKGYQLAYQSL
ncbi:PIR Superfamily Protein [Plasmodium ovale curtisi]|uniref:PIR Superfamily Protein n=1 Tax=Plasmodium ovale curtisi TaxID=864141 RepID=A0A1A8X5Y3_PLAOA|nr:PIR Superfamily Protein [Plasmodium ovale curtisi]